MPEEEDIEEGQEEEVTEEEEETEMDVGEKDEDLYTKEGREKLEDEDEISPEEEAFAEGAAQKGEMGHCATCHKVLDSAVDDVVEEEIGGKLRFFCSENCANNYGKNKKTRKLDEE